MKAFYFELVTGERGTLAGCQDDMSVDEALAALNFQFPERLESVTKSGRDWPDPAQAHACVDERHFPGQLPRLADAHTEGDGPLLLLERLQNIRRRACRQDG